MTGVSYGEESEQLWIVMSSHLSRFRCRQEAWEKSLIVFKASRICSLVFRKIVVSSASWLIINLVLFMSNPLMFEFRTVIASNSVATMNKRGEMLQPCLMPLSTLHTHIDRRLTERVDPLLRYLVGAAILDVTAPPHELLQSAIG